MDRRRCERITEEKKPCCISCVISDALNFRPQLRSRIQFKYFSDFSQISHKVLYYQKLYIARSQVSLYDNNYVD